MSGNGHALRRSRYREREWRTEQPNVIEAGEVFNYDKDGRVFRKIE